MKFFRYILFQVKKMLYKGKEVSDAYKVIAFIIGFILLVLFISLIPLFVYAAIHRSQELPDVDIGTLIYIYFGIIPFVLYYWWAILLGLIVIAIYVEEQQTKYHRSRSYRSRHYCKGNHNWVDFKETRKHFVQRCIRCDKKLKKKKNSMNIMNV